MAYHESLPIYRAACDLMVRLDAVVRGFSRYHKYTMGTRLREKAIEVVMNVTRANLREQRAAVLPRLCAEVEELKLLVNLAREVGAFSSFKPYGQVMEQVVGVAHQAEGWRRSLTEAARPEPRKARGSGT